MMNQQPNAIQYLAKHPFQGNVAQSQLSFQPGAVIVARPNQDGAWWWGSCNGKEGWFPPTYVSVAPVVPNSMPQMGVNTMQGARAPLGMSLGSATATMQPGQPQSMMLGQQQPVQHLMQQATFTSSVQQQQARRQQLQPQQPFATGPPNAAFGQLGSQYPPANAFQGSGPGAAVPQGRPGVPMASSFGGFPSANPQLQQHGPPAAAFGALTPSAAVRPSSLEPQDPFAGLDATPISPTTIASSPIASGGNMQPSFSTSNAATKATLEKNSTTSGVTSNEKADVNAASAAMARLGVTPASTNRAPLVTASDSSGASQQAQAMRTVSPIARSASSDDTSKFTGTSASSNVDTSSVVQSATAGLSSAVREQKKETREEMQLRLAREQEQAEMKAKMRQEKEELRRAQAAALAGADLPGIGSSGANLTIEGGLKNGNDTGVDEVDVIYFNPFDFLNGTNDVFPDRKFSPIYRVPPFWALLNLNTYVNQKRVPKEKLQDRAAMYEQLAKALSFVCYVCVETEKNAKGGASRRLLQKQQTPGKPTKSRLTFLRHNHLACEACIKLINLLPHSAGASGATLDGLFLNFINVFLEVISKVQPNQQLILPGGWQQPDYTYLCLYIIRNIGQNRWSFTVLNTGKDGIQYHPASFDSETGKELKQLAMTIWGKNIHVKRNIFS